MSHYYTPNGESLSTITSRIQAVGVALLFTYSVIYCCDIDQLHLPGAPDVCTQTRRKEQGPL